MQEREQAAKRARWTALGLSALAVVIAGPPGPGALFRWGIYGGLLVKALDNYSRDDKLRDQKVPVEEFDREIEDPETGKITHITGLWRSPTSKARAQRFAAMFL